MNAKNVIKPIGGFLRKHAPTILTTVGVVGFLSSVVTAVKVTPTAAKIIEKEKEEQKVEKLPVKTIVKKTWKLYIPSASSFVVSAGCVVGAHCINSKRVKATAAVASLATTQLKNFKEAAVDIVGKEAADKIENKAADKSQEYIKTSIIDSSSRYTFIDSYSGVKFMSTANKVTAAVNELNSRLWSDDYQTLSDLLYLWGASSPTCSESVGWKIDSGKCEIYTILTQNEETGDFEIMINYHNGPHDLSIN